MGISSVVEWWEEWQLRVLVLSSLLVQWLLFISAIRRKHVISYWSIRSFIWLAYLGSDAIAIYALAALFNRQRKQDYTAANNKSALELVWAPILLMHLGGQDCITAYNIEDNELWRRHVLTAMSQITVAIYIFWKSWPTRGNQNLLTASILVFVPGILKCLEKPWALKSASINSLVSYSDLVLRMAINTGEIISLEEYVKTAKEIVDADGRQPQAQAQGDQKDPSSTRFPPSSTPLPLPPGILRPSQLFADLSSPYPDRIVTLQSFWVLDTRQAYASLQIGISKTFDRLYTKTKMTVNFLNPQKTHEERGNIFLQLLCICIRFSAYTLPYVATSLLLFTSSTRGYDEKDVKITRALFLCTSALEMFSLYANYWGDLKKKMPARKRSLDKERSSDMERSPIMVSQYSLVGFFGRNRRHNTMMHIVGSFGCKDLVDQLWCMKPCRSLAQIIELVIEHVKKGWKEEIYDAASYRKFNDQRGQLTLGANHHQHLGWSLKRPFDQSVLLWHITTDVCFYTSSPHQDVAWCETSPHYKTAIRCREISQYMMYLLFINPEMLLAGTRRNLFAATYDQLEEIFKGQNQCPEIFELEEMRIITMLKSQQGSLSHVRGGFFHDAMALADTLRSLNDERKVWEVIQGVWVEMLCFSASRSRGYLHAKSLGAGGEFLTYVWLLLTHMGMETLPERLQGVELELRNGGTAPSSSGTEMELPSMV